MEQPSVATTFHQRILQIPGLNNEATSAPARPPGTPSDSDVQKTLLGRKEVAPGHEWGSRVPDSVLHLGEGTKCYGELWQGRSFIWEQGRGKSGAGMKLNSEGLST